MNTPQHPEDDRPGNDPLQNTSRDRGNALPGNPYASRYQQSTEPDLDAAAPELRNSELRQMNRRALVLLGAIVVLLLFVAYWLISSTGKKVEQPRQREEKVTVAEAPAPLTVPQLPPALPSQPQPALLPTTQPIPVLPTPPANKAARATSSPTLLERRIAATSTGIGDDGSTRPQAVAAQSSRNTLPGNSGSNSTSAQSLRHADTLMQRGTYIRCVLETRIISDIPGFSSCLVTEPVYSFNGHTLLLPKGSKLLGSYSGGPTGDREAVVWDRIITPTGIDVDMSSPGIDNLGGAGLPGYYDAHWGKRIGSALLISLLSDAFKYAAAEHGPRNTTIANGVVTQTPFESNTAQTVQSLANQAVRAAADRPPTVTINQGTVIYVYVTKDVDFSGVIARS